jgi:hypothetical protein
MKNLTARNIHFCKFITAMFFVAAITSGCKQQTSPTNNVALNESMMTNEPTKCELLTDFTNANDNGNWRRVNDNVMGGRSKGDMEFKDDTMVYAGFINTNGGGFSSIRYGLKKNQLVGFKTLKLRVRTTDSHLKYRVLFEDENRSSINYNNTIPLEKTTEWQEVTLNLSDFKPSRYGNELSRPVFQNENATAIGFITSHKSDSNFKLEIDWMKLCN